MHMEFVPWDPGTTVNVYERRSELMLEDQPPPMRPVMGSGAVSSAKTLDLSVAAPGSYWAIAPIGNAYRYVAFML